MSYPAWFRCGAVTGAFHVNFSPLEAQKFDPYRTYCLKWGCNNLFSRSVYASLNWVIIGSHNGLLLVRHHEIAWTNDDLLLLRPWRANINKTFIWNLNISFKLVHMKISAKWRPLCCRFSVWRHPTTPFAVQVHAGDWDFVPRLKYQMDVDDKQNIPWRTLSPRSYSEMLWHNRLCARHPGKKQN